MHSHNGVGGILDSGEIGKVEVEFKRNRAVGGGGGKIGGGNIQIDGAVAREADINDGVTSDKSFQNPNYTLKNIGFIHPDGDSIVQIDKNGNISQAAWDIGLENM